MGGSVSVRGVGVVGGRGGVICVVVGWIGGGVSWGEDGKVLERGGGNVDGVVVVVVVVVGLYEVGKKRGTGGTNL